MNDSEQTKPIIAIVGPTATGKTESAVHLAGRIGGEIVSADSMAVYRGMDVGTAKPEPWMRAAVAFHLIDVADPGERFNVARFKDLADQAITSIRSRGMWPIVVGGTGLYYRVLVAGFGLTATPANPGLRERLRQETARFGASALHARLAGIDPRAAERIHPNDLVRIIRALEVAELTGVPISEQQAEDARHRTPRLAHRLGFMIDREELDRRIDARVDAMIAAGLEDEVRGLHAQGYGRDLPPLRSLGYKEMTEYIHGECSLQVAIRNIKQNTRRFARRQLTWFRAESGLDWIDVSALTAEQGADVVADRVANRMADRVTH